MYDDIANSHRRKYLNIVNTYTVNKHNLEQI